MFFFIASVRWIHFFAKCEPGAIWGKAKRSTKKKSLRKKRHFVASLPSSARKPKTIARNIKPTERCGLIKKRNVHK